MANAPGRMPCRAARGTYMLLLGLADDCALTIGRAGTMSFAAGGYCYVGSALGPGGLAARLGRHASVGGPRHWHIDYLRPHMRLHGALVSEDGNRHECAWAAWVGRYPGSSCVNGFGASDCRCPGHLFYLGARPADARFTRRAHRELHARSLTDAQLRP